MTGKKSIRLVEAAAQKSLRNIKGRSVILDAYITEKGIKFENIPDSYVIFISKKDFFGKGKIIYHIDRVLRETGELWIIGFMRFM